MQARKSSERDKGNMGRRGYAPEDEKQFTGRQLELLQKAKAIKGLVCGIRVESIEEPLMQEIRYLDKLIDELAKGKSMDKILRR